MMNINDKLRAWRSANSELKYLLWTALEVNYNLKNIQDEQSEINISGNESSRSRVSSGVRLDTENRIVEKSGVISIDALQINLNQSNIEKSSSYTDDSFDEPSNQEVHMGNMNFEEIQHPQSLGLNEVQILIWKNLSLNEKDNLYEIWFEKFDFFQRVRVWNSVEFSLEFFTSLSTKIILDNSVLQMINNEVKYQQREVLNLLSDDGLYLLANIIFTEIKP
jgi:hypothetical protein